MDDSKLPSALVFFVGNYFVTFFIIGLIAAGISLLKKPKPLRISEVAEAFLSYHLLFAIGINNLINFVFHEDLAKEAESLFQTHSNASNEDRLFDRSWAEALLAAGLERLSADYKGESKEKLFNELRIFVAGGADRLPTYAELTDRLGIAESTLRSHVTRLRTRYLEALRAEVRRTVHTETEVDEELRELIQVLTEG